MAGGPANRRLGKPSQSLWPEPRSGPSTAHYLLLAAIHRICQPGPKTEVADWYGRTILHSLWGFPAERFTSQAFWDCFDRIQTGSAAEDELDQAQLRLLAVWKDKQLVSRRLLAYDTTNFYTYVASTNTRNQLAQRGHNKQGRHNLRQVGLSYVLDGENGLSLCHHVYPGNVADAEEFPIALPRMVSFAGSARHCARHGHAGAGQGIGRAGQHAGTGAGRRGLDLGPALESGAAGVAGAPAEELAALSSGQPGVRAAAERLLVHGKEYLCVVKYSAPFASEQLHSLTTTLSKVLQSLRRLSVELAKPGRAVHRSRHPQQDRALAVGRVRGRVGPLPTGASARAAGICSFDFDNAAFQRLLAHRLGRTVLLTNRLDWTAEQVVAGYSGQQQIEQVFRGLKDGDWLGWGPMYHWTDSKIRVHAFYCMLGISLLQYIHKKAQAAWAGLSMEQLLEELRQIQQFVLLYPPQGEKGPNRVATVLSKQTLAQQSPGRRVGPGHTA